MGASVAVRHPHPLSRTPIPGGTWTQAGLLFEGLMFLQLTDAVSSGVIMTNTSEPCVSNDPTAFGPPTATPTLSTQQDAYVIWNGAGEAVSTHHVVTSDCDVIGYSIEQVTPYNPGVAPVGLAELCVIVGVATRTGVANPAPPIVPGALLDSGYTYEFTGAFCTPDLVAPRGPFSFHGFEEFYGTPTSQESRVLKAKAGDLIVCAITPGWVSNGAGSPTLPLTAVWPSDFNIRVSVHLKKQ